MKLSEFKQNLGLKSHPAEFWNKAESNRVQCHLCPRNCQISDQNSGFCRVRWNDGGSLVTLNYGVSVEMTEEVIETEAVYHYAPGSKILSLGNVGCMMNCSYCHNWNTSQMKYVEKRHIHHYTPEQVVSTALEKGINTISWTYNDPVVWHEFVYDTAKLAKAHGIKNLFKSAFYIGPEAIDKLAEVIDIFSLSLKSMDPKFYMRFTKGRLEPVLEAIKQVYRYGNKHLEISNLVVTEANDNMEDVRKVVEWVLKELDDEVPLHFVRFHPDYKYTQVGRTSVEFLKQARQYAIDHGIKHCYLGNVYEKGEWLNSRCRHCNHLLVERFGMRSEATGVNQSGQCSACGAPSRVVPPQASIATGSTVALESYPARIHHNWGHDVNSAHIVAKNKSSASRLLVCAHQGLEGTVRKVELKPGEAWRFLVSRAHGQSTGISLSCADDVEVEIVETLDRAHFPVPTSTPSPLARGIGDGV